MTSSSPKTVNVAAKLNTYHYVYSNIFIIERS